MTGSAMLLTDNRSVSSTGMAAPRQIMQLLPRTVGGLFGAALAFIPSTGLATPRPRFYVDSVEIIVRPGSGCDQGNYKEERSVTRLVDASLKDNEAHAALQNIQWLRDHANLSMSALANIAGVTRKAAYDWLSGSAPREQRATRIASLRYLMERLPVELRASIPAAMDEDVSGSTLREILSNSDVGDDHLHRQVDNALAELKPYLESLSARRGKYRVEYFGLIDPEIRST